MGHKNLIDGVGRDTTAGRCLVDGVGYSIQKGRTLVDGVGYDVAFGAAYNPILNDNEWDAISAASDAGVAESLWSVGDTKTIIINGTAGATTFSNLSVDAFIIGFNHNSDKEGAGRVHFQIGKIGGTDVCLCDGKYDSYQSTSGTFNMNSGKTNSGGWNGSHMRKTVLGSNSTPTSPTSKTLLACLPSELLAVMKPVTKYSDNTGGGSGNASYVTATTEYLWLMSEFEVLGSISRSNSAEQNSQKQYDYYKAGNSKLKYKHNATSTKALWWLRSVYASSGSNFCMVTETGATSGRSAQYSHGIAACFAA